MFPGRKTAHAPGISLRHDCVSVKYYRLPGPRQENLSIYQYQ